MRYRPLFTLFLGMGGAFGGPISAHADQLELFLSERAAQIGYAKPIGVTNSDAMAALFFNEDSDLMINAGLMAFGQPPGQLPFSFGAGAKAYAFSLDDADEDVAAGALGGRVAYTFPANIPMHISAEAFYAPEITTTGEGENMLDFNTRFEVEFIPRTSGFIGYRKLEVDLEDRGDVELDDNIHVGLRLNF
ncbi:MAG: YfaZ family outer membrane protein [Gammaproteobacteria bacterium]